MCRCLYVCVCVCVREREGGWGRGCCCPFSCRVSCRRIYCFHYSNYKCVCVFCKFGLRACFECSARFHVDISSYDAFDAPHSHRCASPQSELDLASVMILDGHIGQGIFFLRRAALAGRGERIGSGCRPNRPQHVCDDGRQRAAIRMDEEPERGGRVDIRSKHAAEGVEEGIAEA